MDQVKLVLDFVWTWRFWFCMGISAILSFLVSPFGAHVAKIKAEQEKKKLDSTFDTIKKYTNGEHPNEKFIKAAQEKTSELSKVVEEAWVELYREQGDLMTWPPRVRQYFEGKPFGAPLKDEEAAKVLTLYRQELQEQFQTLSEFRNIYFFTLQPLLDLSQYGSEGVKGVLEANEDTAMWTMAKNFGNETPTVAQAWLNQEQIWIYRGISKAIASLNEKATTWNDSVVRRILQIQLGENAKDLKAHAAGTELTSILTEEELSASRPTTSGRGAAGNIARGTLNEKRYLVKNEQFRLIPIFVSLWVEQKKVPEVLTAISNMDFNCTIRQTAVFYPTPRVEAPQLAVRQLGSNMIASLAKTATQTIQVDIWASVRIYEMPPSLKEPPPAEKPATPAPGETTPAASEPMPMPVPETAPMPATETAPATESTTTPATESPMPTPMEPPMPGEGATPAPPSNQPAPVPAPMPMPMPAEAPMPM